MVGLFFGYISNCHLCLFDVIYNYIRQKEDKMDIQVKTDRALFLQGGILSNDKQRLEKYIKQEVTPIISAMSIKHLKSIIIVDNVRDLNGAEGEMVPSVLDGEPIETVYYVGNVIFCLQKDESRQKAYPAFYHELCHCKDYENICKKIDCRLLPDLKSEIYTTYDLYLTLGYRFWGEYYAFRTCAFALSISELPLKKMMAAFDTSEKYLKAFVKEFSKDQSVDLYYLTRKEIQEFIYQLVKSIGFIHHYANSIEMLVPLFSDKPAINKFIIDIEKFLFTSYENYPECISIDMLISLGRIIFKLYNIYGIYASDDNLNANLSFFID